MPTAHGFDEFYGIPPNISWGAATYVSTVELTHSVTATPTGLLACVPQIVEATAGGALRTVKPFTPLSLSFSVSRAVFFSLASGAPSPHLVALIARLRVAALVLDLLGLRTVAADQWV